eukprot:gene40432-54680_t
MLFIRFNRLTFAAATLATLAMPAQLMAQTPDHAGDSSAAQFPTARDLKGLTTAGSYLAARHASVERDASSAAAFYRSALRSDPKNNELLDRAFISSLADGDIEEAVKLADRILTIDKSNRVARLVVGVRDLKLKKYAAAQTNINQSVRGPITDLVATLLSAWAGYGAGETKTAIANIDKLAGPEWYPIFKDLHAGMLLDLANKQKDAGIRLERAYKLDDSALRVVDAYARWTSRNKDDAAALDIYENFNKKLARHPLVLEGIRETKAGKKLSPLVDSPQAGVTTAKLADQEKKEAGRKLEYSAVKPDFFVLSGMQGLKKFYVRGTFRDAEVRILTILYDQATEGTMEPVVIAMSSAFNAFPTGAQAIGPPPRKTVEYASGIVVSDDGAIVTDRQAVDGCMSIVVAGYGHADKP